jgi:hypothetical protein
VLRAGAGAGAGVLLLLLLLLLLLVLVQVLGFLGLSTSGGSAGGWQRSTIINHRFLTVIF